MNPRDSRHPVPSRACEFVDIDWCGGRVCIEHRWIARERAGAPTLVFLHEGLGSQSMWRDFPDALCAAADARGLVYSRPGYGRSSPRPVGTPPAPDYLHRQADDVLPALLAALGIDTARDRTWLFGHSDGGSIALIFAARNPGRVAGLIVAAPHIMVEDVTIAGIRRGRDAYRTTDLRERLGRHHDDPDGVFLGWNDVWLSPAFRSWSIERDLAAIDCPILAIQGVDDEYGTLEQIRGIARRVPCTTLLELETCGHSPHRDQRDRLIAAAVEFMRVPR